MRPPERIDEALDLINQIWKKDPDMRFLQLVYVLQATYSELNNRRGRVEERENDGFVSVGFDMFAVEDSDFVDFLKDYLNDNCAEQVAASDR